jgi:hypothetical protein
VVPIWKYVAVSIWNRLSPTPAVQTSFTPYIADLFAPFRKPPSL